MDARFPPYLLAETVTRHAGAALNETVAAELVMLDTSGAEPFASLDLGDGWVLDFTATLRDLTS